MYVRRPITYDDIPNVVVCGMFIAQKYEYALQADADHYTNFLQHFIKPAHENANFHRLVERNGYIYGYLLATINYNLYNGRSQAIKATWVADTRASGQGMRLLAEAEQWAREKGCFQIIVGSPSDRLANVLEHKGYMFREAVFAKDLT